MAWQRINKSTGTNAMFTLPPAFVTCCSSVISACDRTKQFKGLTWFSIRKIFYFTAFFGLWYETNKTQAVPEVVSNEAAQPPGATTRERIFHTQTLYLIHLNTFPFKYLFKCIWTYSPWIIPLKDFHLFFNHLNFNSSCQLYKWHQRS